MNPEYERQIKNHINSIFSETTDPICQFQLRILEMKREKMIRKSCPRTVGKLGQNFHAACRSHLKSRWPSGKLGLYEDPIIFLQNLLSNPSTENFIQHEELLWLKFIQSRKWFQLTLTKTPTLKGKRVLIFCSWRPPGSDGKWVSQVF